MPRRSTLLVLCFLALLCYHPQDSCAQRYAHTFTLTSATDSVVVLADSFFVLSSLQLRVDNSLTLRNGVDFTIDDSDGVPGIVLAPSVRSLLFGASLSGEHSATHLLDVSCDLCATSLKRSYTLFSADTNTADAIRDSAVTRSRTSSTPSPQPSEPFTFSKAGGITRGVQVGTSQDATFNNSFNLSFSGALGDDLEFKGALSEESTPLQPEGNTQTLRDIDRIYIELHSPKRFSATIGDFPLALSNIRQDSLPSSGYFDQISRKVLGAMAAVEIGPTAVAAGYSVTKGQFVTNSLQGLDGVQGPYRLTGKNGEQAIIVIAGTEHVYIDGVLMTRGEQNDYVIDYGLAQIQFTTKRIVTASSRITVDFEYTAEQYSRELIVAKQSTSFLGNRINFTTSYLREGDDPNNPRELSLSDSDKSILSAAGNDPSNASKSGVTIAARDSNGRARGYYSPVDTVIAGASSRFYRYAPFDTINSIYNISFGFAGQGKGQYVRESVGQYSYVGPGRGDYDTLVFLPFPQLHQLASATLTLRPFDGLGLYADGAISALNANRFSSLGAVSANAYRLRADYNDTIAHGMFPIVASVRASDAFTAAEFAPFDRIRNVESMRAYGLENGSLGTAQLGRDEHEQTAGIRLALSRLALSMDVGSYSLGSNAYSATNYSYGATFDGTHLPLPDLRLAYSLTPTSDSSLNVDSRWSTFAAAVTKVISDSLVSLQPTLSYTHAVRKSTDGASFSNDSLLPESFRFSEIGGGVAASLTGTGTLSARYTYRTDDSVRNALLQDISHASEFVLSASLTPHSGFSAKVDLGMHSRTFLDSLSKAINGGDNSSLLLHIVPRYRSGNGAVSVEADYQGSELRTAAMQRLFFAVPPGQGNYMYLGDLNKNGKQDAEEFQPARYADQGTYILLTIPSDQLEPTVDLHSSYRLRFMPSQLPASNPLQLLSPLSFESYIRVDENSTDRTTSDIYLYRLSHFLRDSTTIHGIQEFQQDIDVLDNNPSASFRMRWNERRIASQYTTGLERSYHRELSLRSRLRLSDEITSEENGGQVVENVATSSLSSNRPQQSRRYWGDLRLSLDPLGACMSYSLFASFASIRDAIYLADRPASIDILRASARYAISTALSFRAELSRNEFIAHTADATFLPYGVSDGLAQGITWQWSLGADQEISRGVIVNVSYDGRSEPSASGSHLTHTARAEIRASF
ncbi:MAG: hypothetical protein JSS75_13060 [Bacteroidetes bacterium]|nr:hypothetical protein [Bacteroidota bacterium]